MSDFIERLESEVLQREYYDDGWDEMWAAPYDQVDPATHGLVQESIGIAGAYPHHQGASRDGDEDMSAFWRPNFLL